MVVALDENVGRVLDYLDRTGLATNTIVIYTSDNGFFLGEHGFYNKMWMYEDGFQIPLIIRLPGNHGGRINPEIVSMMDIAPTILDLCGVRVPQDIQGCSMKPLLTGETAPWRESFYYHYYGYCLPRSNNWIASEDGEIFGIRTKTAKLICYPRWNGGPFWELFDLEKDPLEIHNLYADSSHRGLRAALTRQMRALAEQYKDFKTVAVVDALARRPPTRTERRWTAPEIHAGCETEPDPSPAARTADVCAFPPPPRRPVHHPPVRLQHHDLPSRRQRPQQVVEGFGRKPEGSRQIVPRYARAGPRHKHGQDPGGGGFPARFLSHSRKEGAGMRYLWRRVVDSRAVETSLTGNMDGAILPPERRTPSYRNGVLLVFEGYQWLPNNENYEEQTARPSTQASRWICMVCTPVGFRSKLLSTLKSYHQRQR